MRFVIDVTTEKSQSVGNMLASAEKKGELKILDKGDPLEKVKASLADIKTALDLLNKSGINKDIMIAYIHTKGHIPIGTINEVLFQQKEFFEKLGAKPKAGP